MPPLRLPLPTLVALAYLVASWLHGSTYRAADALTCFNCSNWDNASSCLDKTIHTHSTVTELPCNASLEVDGKKAYCLQEITDECQQMIFKSSADTKGNGGEVAKKWFKGKCVYMNPNEGRMKEHSECYWEKTRQGRDILHEKTGFQVIGRSIIRRTCHCSADLCNNVEGKECRNRVNTTQEKICGPNCMQVSRDQMETPGEDKEEFRDKCPEKQKDEKNHLYPDCGTDPGRMEPTMMGGLTYRHKCVWGKKDGVRDNAASLLSSHIWPMLAVGVLVANVLA